MTRQRLVVDPVACEGRGLCLELLPELLESDDWGFPIVAPGPVPPELMAAARRAVAACPVLALRLVAGEGGGSGAAGGRHRSPGAPAAPAGAPR